MVLHDYLELSGQSIHKTVTNNHFLTITGEFGADSGRIIGGISIGFFFHLRCSDIPPRVNHYVKSALQLGVESFICLFATDSVPTLGSTAYLA